MSIAILLAKKASAGATNNSDGSDMSAQDIIDAVHEKDHKKLKDALRNFHSSQPEEDLSVDDMVPMG